MARHTNIVIGGALILLVLAMLGYYAYNGSLSLISLSNVNYHNSGNAWIASATVDQANETIEFTKYTNCTAGQIGCMLQNNANGTQTRGQSTIDVTLNVQQPYCDYQLSTNSLTAYGLGYPNNTLQYFSLGNATQSAPFTVTVAKNGSVIAGPQNFNALTDTTAPMVGGQVQINNLGILSGGEYCPSGGAAYLVSIPGSNTYALVDKPQFDAYAQAVKNYSNCFFACTNPGPIPTGAPTVFNNTNPLTAQVTPNSNNLRAMLPQNLGGSSLIKIVVSNQLADTVTYTPPNPQPSNVNITLSASMQQTATQTMTVTFNNTGTTGTFDITPTSQNNLVTFTPAKQSVTVDAAASGTATFQVYGLNSGNDIITARVTGISSGATAQATTSLIITATPGIQNATNQPVLNPQNTQYQSAGQATTCSSSTTLVNGQCVSNTANPSSSPTTLPPQSCTGLFQTYYQNSQPILGGLLGTSTTSGCQTDYLFVGMAGALLLVLVFGAILLSKRRR